MTRPIAVGALAALSLCLLGCGEKPQSSGTRKVDTQPYTAATGTHTASGWQAGDAASWDKQITTRTQNGQNEYVRTGPN